MKTKNDVFAFIQETISRVLLKSPKYFRIWQYIGILAVGVGYLPVALEWLDLTTTPIFDKYIQLAFKVAGGVTWFMTNFPVVNSNTIKEATDKLPYSDKKTIQGVEPTPIQTLNKIQDETSK